MGSSAVCQSFAMNTQFSSPYVVPPQGTCHTASSAALLSMAHLRMESQQQFQDTQIGYTGCCALSRSCDHTPHLNIQNVPLKGQDHAAQFEHAKRNRKLEQQLRLCQEMALRHAELHLQGGCCLCACLATVQYIYLLDSNG